MAELPDKEPLVVLDTQWLGFTVIGPLLAGDEFKDQFEPLPRKQFYTQAELEGLYRNVVAFDVLKHLLLSLELMVQEQEDRYIIPAKLPTSDKRPSSQLKFGRCNVSKDKSIFAPMVFPTIQARIFNQMKGSLVYSDYVEIKQEAADQAGGLVWKMGDNAVGFGVKNGKSQRNEMLRTLNKLNEIVVSVIIEFSPGTTFDVGMYSL